jgi:glycosyltransferase involved in cell wall biosynthesis
VKLIEALEHSPTAFAALLARLDLGLVFAPGSDGTSRAAVEMLACGVPLLVADVPGLRELAADTACVICLPPEQPHVWAQAVWTHLQRSPEQITELRAKARAHAEQHHSLKAHGLALAKFYEK